MEYFYEFFHNEDGSWTYKLDTLMQTRPTLSDCIEEVEKIKFERGLVKEA